MADKPEVPWRFGERYLVTDFVMTNNIAIMEQAGSLHIGNNDSFVEAVARWIRDEFFYPLDNAGNPSASGQFLRHRKGLIGGHFFKKSVYYMWGLPVETLAIGCGICVDTANLTGSVLRSKELDGAWICLGDVRSSRDDTLLGRHAWVEVPYHGASYLIETTAHELGANNLVESSQVYDRTSRWVKRSGLYYVPQARYNESEFVGDGPLGAQIVEVMGLPAKRVLLFGVDAARSQKPHELYKEWRQEELLKERLLKEAYRE
jgi:hypothetical protein